MTYPAEHEARQSILEAGRRMYQRGFVAANDGNLSCRVGENALWATPTGVSKGFMDEDMLVKCDLDGRVLEGMRAPSSELKMHLRAYRENPALCGVAHAHPPACTAFSIAGLPLDRPVLTEAVASLGPIPVAPYATPGTAAVPESIVPFLRSHNGALLANHGALAWGRSVMEAWYRLESMELYANILLMSGYIIKRQNELDAGQVAVLEDIRRQNEGG